MIRKYTISPPLAPQPGDTFAAVAGVLEQRRGGALVAFRTLAEMASVPLTTPETVGSPLSVLYLEVPVPGQIVTLTSVAKNTSTGVVRFKFSNGTEREFADEAAALVAVEYLDTDPATCEDALILKTLRISPDGTNLSNQVGSSCSSDFNADVPVVLTEGN